MKFKHFERFFVGCEGTVVGFMPTKDFSIKVVLDPIYGYPLVEGDYVFAPEELELIASE